MRERRILKYQELTKVLNILVESLEKLTLLGPQKLRSNQVFVHLKILIRSFNDLKKGAYMLNLSKTILSVMILNLLSGCTTMQMLGESKDEIKKGNYGWGTFYGAYSLIVGPVVDVVTLGGTLDAEQSTTLWTGVASQQIAQQQIKTGKKTFSNLNYCIKYDDTSSDNYDYFTNNCGQNIKILWWEGDGYASGSHDFVHLNTTNLRTDEIQKPKRSIIYVACPMNSTFAKLDRRWTMQCQLI